MGRAGVFSIRSANMAKFVVQDPIIKINGGTVSANVAQVTIALEADDVETTNFASGGNRERVGGLKSGSVSFDLHQDFAAGALNDIIYPLLGGTASIEVVPTAGTAVSSSNPRFAFSVLCTEFSPLDSAVGDLATTSVSWPITGAVTRGTTA
jgi:hypothetical protein